MPEVTAEEIVKYFKPGAVDKRQVTMIALALHIEGILELELVSWKDGKEVMRTPFGVGFPTEREEDWTYSVVIKPKQNPQPDRSGQG